VDKEKEKPKDATAPTSEKPPRSPLVIRPTRGIFEPFEASDMMDYRFMRAEIERAQQLKKQQRKSR